MRYLISYKKTPVDIVNFYIAWIAKPSEEDVVDLVDKHSKGNYLAGTIEMKEIEWVAEDKGGYAGEGEEPRPLSRLEFFARFPYLSRCDLSES